MSVRGQIGVVTNMKRLELGALMNEVSDAAESEGMNETSIVLRRIAKFLLGDETQVSAFFDVGAEKTSPPIKLPSMKPH